VVGLSVSEKSGSGAAFTTRLTVVVCVNVPLVPEIVNVEVPAGVEADVVTVSVDVPPPPGTGLVDHEVLVFAGRPLTARLTVPVKPPLGVIVAA
jgi:hypothetical protein